MVQDRLLIVGGGFIGQSIKKRNKNALLVASNTCTSDATYPSSVAEWIEIFEKNKITKIISCFGVASVAKVVESPNESFADQMQKSQLLLGALAIYEKKIPILVVGSAAEYGCITDRRISENDEPTNINIYGSLKLTLFHTCMFFHRHYNLPIIYVRQFNTSGPLQRRDFVLPSLVCQYLELLDGSRDVMEVGDLEVCRDFIHIEDTISAYEILLEKGVFGEVYNVSLGQGALIKSVLEYLESKGGVSPKFEIDSSLTRQENKTKNSIVGNNSKLRHLGWVPKYDVKAIIDSIYSYCKEQEKVIV